MRERRLTRLARVLPLLALLLTAARPARAQLPPNLGWRTIESAHFRVTYAPGLEPLAVHAAAAAERTRARLAAELGRPPEAPVDIVLTDAVDVTNGYATPFPYDHIVIYARPPTDVPSLAFTDDWLGMVVAHEYTHVVHLNQAGPFGRMLRGIFGNVPSSWPMYPVEGVPSWDLEGLAVLVESRETGEGRIWGSWHDMVLRTAVLEHRLDPIDRASNDSPIWPAGDRFYVYGSMFLDWLRETRGMKVERALVRATAGAVIPPELAFDRVAKHAMGESFSAAWADWTRHLEAKYGALADSLRGAGLTTPERLTGAGYYALYPRVSRDGRSVAFAASDGRSTPATRVLDVASGQVRDVSRRNGLDPAAWLPGGTLLTAQLRYDGPYRIFSDLYRQQPGDESRLTSGARLAQVDVDAVGRRAVTVQDGPGANRLAVYDLPTGRLRPLGRFAPDTAWAFPRWSHDGTRIAASRWTRDGRYDVVVLDTLGTVLREITRGPALDMAPAWSADDRWLVFSSDRDGVPNLYAADLETAAPRVADSVAGAALDTTAEPAARRKPGAAPGDTAAPVDTTRGKRPGRGVPPGRPPALAALQDTLGTTADTEVAPVVARDSAVVLLKQVTNVLTGAFFPDISPDGRWIYFAGYHADGFHLERIRFDPASWREPTPARIGRHAAAPVAAIRLIVPVHADTAVLRGPHAYSSLATVLPHYWVPFVGGDSVVGFFFGLSTSGQDLVGRSAWAAGAGWDFTHQRLRGYAAYDWAGLANPVLGLAASSDWSLLGRATLPDNSVRDVLEREDVYTADATLLSRHWRSAASLTFGGQAVHRHRQIEDAPTGIALRHPKQDLAGGFLSASFANYRVQPFSISREDGVVAAARLLRRWDLAPDSLSNGGYREAIGRMAAYRALPLPGFAHPVLAARLSGIVRTGPGAETEPVGGSSGEGSGTLGVSLGASRLLPVRGFVAGTRRGTRAWSASLEYRQPLALVGRGHALWPIFLDRLFAAAYLDAGNATCSAAETAASGELGPCARPSGNPVLLGAGAELAADLGILFVPPFEVRAGFGFPLHGEPRHPARFYLQFGPSF